MPASKVSKSAAAKKKAKTKAAAEAKAAEKKQLQRRRASVASRRWVPWVFLTVGILGGLWLVVYYIAGVQIPYMRDLGDWNVLIGMGLMALAFAISTLWK